MRSASAVNSRQWQLAIARAHREDSARARPSAWVLNSRRVTARDNSRPWQLASLVLIEKIAHVRGGGRAVASVKFFDETFLQKSFDLALALTGRQPGKKLGKQRSAFPGRRSASAVNSRRVTARDNSRPWQLASLVLIEKIAHVRGGGCKGAAGTLPPPLTNAAERGTIEIEKESLPVRRLAQFMYYLRSSRNPWTGAATFSCF